VSALAQTDWLTALTAYGDRLSSGSYRPIAVLVELLLIGGVVYAILRFLRGTRGDRLVKGLGLVVLVSFVVVGLMVQQLQLDRIIFLYRYFITGVFLIALVAFQTEIRRGLIRIGEGLWWRRSSKDVEKIVEPIATAVASLAKRKVGAVIAIERTTEIGALVETGIAIEGVLSAELLESIFWPGSTLHDMGVVIHQGRVAAARCQFPLADHEDVDRSLGSRHRAAVGISRECDALVVVVSEETGIISLAEFGRLRRALSPDGLRSALYAGLTRTAPSPKPAATPRPVETSASESAAEPADEPAESPQDPRATSAKSHRSELEVGS